MAIPVFFETVNKNFSKFSTLFKSISNSLSGINFNKISVDVVINELNEIENNKKLFDNHETQNKNFINKNFEILEIDSLSFSYDNIGF